MIKPIAFFFCLLLASCTKTKENHTVNSASSPQVKNDESTEINEEDYKSSEASYVGVDSAKVMSEADKCFKSDNDVLEFVKGKTYVYNSENFHEYWTFNSKVITRTSYRKMQKKSKEGRYYLGYEKEIKEYKHVRYLAPPSGLTGAFVCSEDTEDRLINSLSINCQNILECSSCNYYYELGDLVEFPDSIH